MFLGDSYHEIDDRLSRAIHLRFGLPGELPQWVKKAIKKADKTVAYIEAVQIAGFSQDEAKRYIANPRNVPMHNISPLSPNKAKLAYRKRFDELMDGMATPAVS